MKQVYSASFVFSRTVLPALLLFISGSLLQGQPLFQKAIGAEGFEKGSAAKLLSDNGFVIVGETESFGLTERDMLLIRTDSAGNTLWMKSFGGPERETVNDVLQTTDRGYMLVAEKYQPNQQEGENLTLLKTDENGNLQWKKTYDEGGNETEGFSIQPTPDKGYLITGMVKGMDMVSSAFFTMRSENQSLYLLKIDANGNKQWSRRLSSIDNNVSSTGISVTIARDGSYMVSGNIMRQGKTDKKIDKPAQTVNMEDVRNVLLAKVKPNGTLQWIREYQANRITVGYTVIEKREGGFMLVGNTNVSKSNLDIFLMSLDVSGGVQWAKTFGGTGFESVADLAQTPDGGFVVTGMTHSFGNGSVDVLTFKTDKDGNLKWANSYGGKNEEYPSKLLLTATGIVTVGSTASNGSESYDVLLMKTDFNGNGSCIAKPVTLTTGNFQPAQRKVDKPSMAEVEQGITPPNMKKVDAGNIMEKKRTSRTKNLCN